MQTAYAKNLWNELESVWDLCIEANQLPDQLRCDFKKIWFDWFRAQPLMDIALTEAVPNLNDPRPIFFCKNSYGVHFNDELKMWFPCRHREVDWGQL